MAVNTWTTRSPQKNPTFTFVKRTLSYFTEYDIFDYSKLTAILLSSVAWLCRGDNMYFEVSLSVLLWHSSWVNLHQSMNETAQFLHFLEHVAHLGKIHIVYEFCSPCLQPWEKKTKVPQEYISRLYQTVSSHFSFFVMAMITCEHDMLPTWQDLKYYTKMQWWKGWAAYPYHIWDNILVKGTLIVLYYCQRIQTVLFSLK